MYKGHTVSIVVPAYNEESQIHLVLGNIPEYVDHVVVVDDASSDATSERVKDFQAKDTRITLIRHETNQGVGGAIATGYEWARDKGLDTAVVMAGDGQMDPADLPALLDAVVVDGVDYAKGNRLFTGEAWRIIPRWRYLGNSALSLLTKIASGYWHVADSQSGYTVINKKALAAINWQKMYRRFGQPNDLLVRLNICDLKVRDVPIRPIYNIGEKSGIRPFHIMIPIFTLIVRLFLKRMVQKYIIRDFHPLVFFYFLGIFLLFFATPILLIRLVALWIGTGSIPEINTLMAMFTSITGLQFLLFAMWFDMENNRHLR